MFSKALLLGGSGKVNTTGKFALTNGYKFKATDPDFPGWGEYNYGYISNDIGDVTPVPKLRGHTLCSFYYNDRYTCFLRNFETTIFKRKQRCVCFISSAFWV